MSFATFEQLVEMVNPKARAQDDILSVAFYSRDMMDEAASIEAQRPIYKKVDFIRIRIPGDPLNIVDQPVWNDPRHAHSHTNRFKRQWEDYKAGREQEQMGTPLKALTFLAPPILHDEQVAELKHFGVHTAEQLAEMPDNIAAKFLGGYEMKSKTAAWLEMSKKNAPNAALLAELKTLRETVQAQGTRLAELGEHQTNQPRKTK